VTSVNRKTYAYEAVRSGRTYDGCYFFKSFSLHFETKKNNIILEFVGMFMIYLQTKFQCLEKLQFLIDYGRHTES
jgi:hypothetical protein